MSRKTKFSKELRKLRGDRYQKEAAAIIGVSVRVYEKWEEGLNKPSKVCESCALRKLQGLE